MPNAISPRQNCGAFRVRACGEFETLATAHKEKCQHDDTDTEVDMYRKDGRHGGWMITGPTCGIEIECSLISWLAECIAS